MEKEVINELKVNHKERLEKKKKGKKKEKNRGEGGMNESK